MTFTHRLRSLRLISATAATIAAAALLLTGCSSDGDGTHACPSVHSKAGDVVPAYAARPCVVYPAGSSTHGAAADSGHTTGGTSGSSGKGTSKTNPKVKAPAAKVPAAKAPAVKAPAAPPIKVAPPLVRLTK
ncbi:hypothetical protein [Streptomyces sp. BH055]|uniref:hypothetical protein n=1 Tax=unclassified Streptomyces TaxID=2593676 RepID=UPI003BB48EE4